MPPPRRPPAAEPRVLVFTRTAGFRHACIPAGTAAVAALGGAAGFAVDATEDPAAFRPDRLARYRAVVWLCTSGEVLDPAQQAAFAGYLRAGGGFVGVHGAADTGYSWPWYGGLVGAWFTGHPPVQPATIRVEDRTHPSTAHLPPAWDRTDEWYSYHANPRPGVHVLASLDESSYAPDRFAMGDHPIAWCHRYGGGRAWYTGGGHTEQSYAEPAFLAHLLGGIRYAAGQLHADCQPEPGYTPIHDGSGAGWSGFGAPPQVGPDATLTWSGGAPGRLWYTAREVGGCSVKLGWRLDPGGDAAVVVGGDPAAPEHRGVEVPLGALAANPPGHWNTCAVERSGGRLTVLVNGEPVAGADDPRTTPGGGYLGLRYGGGRLEVRDVRLRGAIRPAG